MIEKIRIRNFRSIDSQTFKDIDNLLVFVGENNSGKSTVLNALRIINDLEYKPSHNDIKHGCDFFEIIIVKSIDGRFYEDLMRLVKYRNIFKDFTAHFQNKTKNERATNTKIFRDEFKRFIIDKALNGKKLSKIRFEN